MKDREGEGFCAFSNHGNQSNETLFYVRQCIDLNKSIVEANASCLIDQSKFVSVNQMDENCRHEILNSFAGEQQHVDVIQSKVT